ncbi:hypothetical protein RYX36_012411 [Vicia faba]
MLIDDATGGINIITQDFYLVYILTEMVESTLMVFTQTCDATRFLALILRNLSLKVIPINGHMSQVNTKKNIAISRFDIPVVDMVINYHIPTNSKNYIHRAERTARVGHFGIVISLVNQYDLEWFIQIKKLIG